MPLDAPPQIDTLKVNFDPAPVVRSADSIGIKVSSLNPSDAPGPVTINAPNFVQAAETASVSSASPAQHHHRAHHHNHHWREKFRPIGRFVAHTLKLGGDTAHAVVSSITRARDANQRWADVEVDKKLIGNDVADIEHVWSPLKNTSVTRAFSTVPVFDPGTGRMEKAHKGVDLHAPQGTPVYAPANAVVVAVKKNNGNAGNQVVLQHTLSDGNYLTKYDHLSRFATTADGKPLKAGDIIKQGQVIAYSGRTGDAKGAHLHYEMINPRGEHINPITHSPALAMAAHVHPDIMLAKNAHKHSHVHNAYARNGNYNLAAHYKHSYTPAPKLT